MLGPKHKKFLLFFLLGSIAALIPGCSSQSPSALYPASPNATSISNLFYFIFWIAVAVFVIVEALLLYSVVRFRRKSDDEMPTQVHGNTKLEIAWTLAPAVVLAIVFVLTYQTLTDLANVPKDSLPVHITGHQWWWEVEYPSLGVLTANEIHLPAMQPASFTVESKDVIHSFWVPELGGKMDVIPGKKNVTWFNPTQVGTFHGQCAEFCGAEHALMRFSVVVESQDQFNAWVAAQKEKAAPTEALTKGLGIFSALGCQACHAIDGTPAQGKVGPDLTHLASRKTIAAGSFDMTTANLRAWITNPQALKPGVAMPTLPMTPDQVDALMAMLQSLK
jgi:cytochrome c oxidase subunit II